MRDQGAWFAQAESQLPKQALALSSLQTHSHALT